MAENEVIRDNPTTVSGLRAIEMRYRPIYDSFTKGAAFYQSSMRLNAPDMGVLLPERFMPVVESDDRCIPLFKLALLQTIKAADKFNGRELDFDWISVNIPLRLLRRSDCTNILTEFTGMVGAKNSKICLEIPSSVFDDEDSCSKSIRKLKDAGFHTMITGVDAVSFPLMRLADFEPEYVMLDEAITASIGKDKRSDTCICSLITLIRDLDAEPIATGVASAETAEKFYEFECSYYTGAGSATGDFSGNFLQERFIRRKNQEHEQDQSEA